MAFMDCKCEQALLKIWQAYRTATSAGGTAGAYDRHVAPAILETYRKLLHQRQGVPERQPERTRPATAGIAQAVDLLVDALNMERAQAMPEIVAALKKTHSTLLNQLAGAVLEAVASRPEEDLRIHPGLLKMAKELHRRVQDYFV